MKQILFTACASVLLGLFGTACGDEEFSPPPGRFRDVTTIEGETQALAVIGRILEAEFERVEVVLDGEETVFVERIVRLTPVGGRVELVSTSDPTAVLASCDDAGEFNFEIDTAGSYIARVLGPEGEELDALAVDVIDGPEHLVLLTEPGDPSTTCE